MRITPFTTHRTASLENRARLHALENTSWGDLHAFGGKLSVGGGLKPLETLSAAHPSLAFAQTVLERWPGLYPLIDAHLDALELPQSFDLLAERQLELGRARESSSAGESTISPRGALGANVCPSLLAFHQALSSGQVGALLMDDASLLRIIEWGHRFDLGRDVANGDEKLVRAVLHLYARAKELGANITVDKERVLALLTLGQSDIDVGWRLARAFGWDPTSMQLRGQTLSAWGPSVAMVVPPALLPDDHAFWSFVERGIDARRDGKAIACDANAWSDPRAIALAYGLSGVARKEEIVAALKAKGWQDQTAETWARLAVRLAALPPEAFVFVTRDLLAERGRLDMAVLSMRASLVDRIDAASIDQLDQKYGATHADQLAAILLERALYEPSGPSQEALVARVRDMVTGGRLAKGELGRLTSREAIDLLMPERDEYVAGALADVADPEQRVAALSELRALLELSELRGDLAAKVGESLFALRGAELTEDLAEGLPIPQLLRRSHANDAEIKKEIAQLSPFPPGTKTVDVLGVPLAIDTRADKDQKAIPKSSTVVMTPTTALNMKPLLVAWRSKKPTAIYGDSGTGKTTLISHLCYLTKSPYRRFVGSSRTTVEDLIGMPVGGKRKYTRALLDPKNDYELKRIARLEFKIEGVLTREELMERVLDADRKPRWVDGLIVKAALRGETLVLDEFLLMRLGIRGKLHQLFDEHGNLTIPMRPAKAGGPKVVPQENFRVFITTNDASFVGRQWFTRAEERRLRPIRMRPYEESDYKMMLETTFKEKIPPAIVTKISRMQQMLAALATQRAGIGSSSGGVAYTPRSLFKVAERFVEYRGTLPDLELLRREAEEIYLERLWEPRDRARAKIALDQILPYQGPSFYKDLKLSESKTAFQIGDTRMRRLDFGDHPAVPKEQENGRSTRLVLTERFKVAFYKMTKALARGERVLLVGDRASGKTAMAKMFAALMRQPFFPYNYSEDTDTTDTIGHWSANGWQNGALLIAAGVEDKTPHVLLRDEINLARPDIRERENSALDHERRLVVYEKESDEIDLPNDMHIISAMNPPGKNYGAAKRISPAELDRYTVVTVPTPETTAELLAILAAYARNIGLREAQLMVPAVVELHKAVLAAYASKDHPLGNDVPLDKRPDYSLSALFDCLDMMHAMCDETPAAAFTSACTTAYAARSKSDKDYDAVVALISELVTNGPTLEMQDAEPIDPVEMLDAA